MTVYCIHDKLKKIRVYQSSPLLNVPLPLTIKRFLLLSIIPHAISTGLVTASLNATRSFKGCPGLKTLGVVMKYVLQMKSAENTTRKYELSIIKPQNVMYLIRVQVYVHKHCVVPENVHAQKMSTPSKEC